MMMWKYLAPITVVSAMVAVLPVKAATVAYDFTVTPDFGPLAGEVYQGSVIFDDQSLLGFGEEFLPESVISQLTFEFEGTTYTLADALVAEVKYLDGDFLGLNYATDAEFALQPGSIDLGDAQFSYSIASGAGFGDVVYQEGMTPIPEPSFLLGSLGLGITGLLRRYNGRQD
jgi:hypothetical protein